MKSNTRINRFCNGIPLDESALKSIIIQDPVVLDIVKQVQHRMQDTGKKI